MMVAVMRGSASDNDAVMAGHSRSKDGVAFARLCPPLVCGEKHVDARDKPGHDEAVRCMP
jgi:hypothetical protein